MEKLRYSFTLQKKAVVRFPKGIVDLGQVSNYSDINGKVSVTIMLNRKLPTELLRMIEDDPTKISIIGQPKDISKAELTDLIETNEE